MRTGNITLSIVAIIHLRRHDKLICEHCLLFVLNHKVQMENLFRQKPPTPKQKKKKGICTRAKKSIT